MYQQKIKICNMIPQDAIRIIAQKVCVFKFMTLFIVRCLSFAFNFVCIPFSLKLQNRQKKKKMLALLKIGIVIYLVFNCACVTQTAEQQRNSVCANKVSNCSFGTEEVYLGGIRYCLSSCPKHDIRLSDRICVL